jgi:hypothetical protein
MTTDFYPADVGRDIVGGGGLGTITAYVDPNTVTVQVLQPFPANLFETQSWAIAGSPNATLTPSAKDPVGAPVNLGLSLAGWRPEDVGKYVRVNGGLVRITSLVNSSSANGVIVRTMSSTVAAPGLSWTLEGGMWGGAFGYPRCGTLYQQRLWLAGSGGFPQTVWASALGENLDFTIGALDDDGMTLLIAGGETNPIMHLANASGLVALTSAGEFSLRGGQDKAIAPTNLQVKDQSNFGTSQVTPTRVGAEIYFVQRASRKLRALSPNQYDDNQYVAPDMAVLAEHVTTSGITDMAYQADPDPVLYVTRNDGQIATLTADRDQDVFAWSRQITQGAFEAVESVPTADGDEVYVVVARAVGGVTKRFIEKFDPDLHTDCAVTGHSDAGATTWGGFSHLVGRTVQAKGDGVYLGDFVVNGSGQITLPRPAFDVEIGLAYVTAVKTLTPEFMAPTGSSQGHQLSVHEVKVRLLETIGCQLNLQEVAFRRFGLGVLDKPPEPYTGDKKAGNLGWGDGAYATLVQQILPYPFHLLSVITRLTANEG